MKNTLLNLSLGTTLALSCNAASFTIGGGSAVAWTGTGGGTIATSSIVQVGYFNDPLASTDPASYSTADWESFVPISGIDSLNPAKNTTVDAAGGPGTFGLSLGLDSSVDTLPASYSKRLGIRVYDSTTTTTGVNYNTVSVFTSDWILQDPDSGPPSPTPPNLLIQATDEPGIAWQDGGANAFQTTIVPEPSSLALLGLGALTLTFRRKK